jgi:polyphenol oxidase
VPQEAVAVAVDHVGNALDFGRIETDTYNFHSRFGSYMTLPPVPASFYWSNETWGAALRCRPLERFAQHLFTTRQLQLPSADAWHALTSAMSVPPGRIVSMNQLHGRTVAQVDRNVSSQTLDDMHNERPRADALISDASDIALVVRAADCVPLLIADARTGAVAAVHAGWRGTAARVAVAAVEEMQRQFRTRAADLAVAIGPAIGSCCYEVGSDLVDAFAAAGHERYLIDRWFMTPREGRMRLDLVGANRDQLILAGVREENVHACGLCTAMHLDVLTSFRAEQSAAGRIAGVIRASAPTTTVNG